LQASDRNTQTNANMS